MTGYPGRPLRYLCIAVCLTQSAGCAFGTRVAELHYPPQNAVALETADLDEPLPSGISRAVVLSVEDARDTKDRIGNVRNTYGMDTASIISEDNVAVWVGDAITAELQQRGYRVLRYGREPDAGADRLETRIEEVYCDIYAVYDGEVTLAATLKRPGIETVEERFSSKVNSGLAFTMGADPASESLSQALQLAVRRMLYRLGFDGSPDS